jgi:hypothetical protein
MVITSWNSQQQSMSCSLVVVVGQGSSRSSKRREIPDHHRRNVANHLLQTAASSVQQLLDFERQGHLCARAFFNPQELSSLEACVTEAAESQKLNAYRHRVAVLCPGVDPFSVKTIQEAQNIIRLKGTDELGFLQTFNLHQRSQAVREWTSHPRLCSTVAALLGVERVSFSTTPSSSFGIDITVTCIMSGNDSDCDATIATSHLILLNMLLRDEQLDGL